jgi:riboflavin-specific deaminase-like protein
LTGGEPGPRATRLYPLPPRETPIENVYADLELARSAHVDPHRPYVMVNMISSLDGKTTLGGKTSGIGSAVDRLLMRTLRSKADAVMIGANTLRAERLSLGLDEPARASHPLAVVVTASGDVPAEQNLILGQDQDLLVIVPEGVTARVSWGRGRTLVAPAGKRGTISLGEALRTLKTEYAVDHLLVEGGPSLNHSLISGGLVDELFITLSPKLLGGTAGEALTILDGPELQEARTATLLSAHLCQNELFLRYRLQTPA